MEFGLLRNEPTIRPYSELPSLAIFELLFINFFRYTQRRRTPNQAEFLLTNGCAHIYSLYRTFYSYNQHYSNAFFNGVLVLVAFFNTVCKVRLFLKFAENVLILFVLICAIVYKCEELLQYCHFMYKRIQGTYTLQGLYQGERGKREQIEQMKNSAQLLHYPMGLFAMV